MVSLFLKKTNKVKALTHYFLEYSTLKIKIVYLRMKIKEGQAKNEKNALLARKCSSIVIIIT